MSLSEFIAYLDTLEKFLLVLGVLLILLGVLSPTKFLGVEVAWTPLKSVCVLVLGVVMLGLSFPQLRLYALPERITLDEINSLNTNLAQGRQLTYAASTNTSDPATSCAGRASQSLPYLDSSLKVVAAMQTVLAPPGH